MKPTGNFYLLYLIYNSTGRPTYLAIDYTTSTTTTWDFDITNPVFLSHSNLPSPTEVLAMYDNKTFTAKLLPLTSSTSAAIDYPELFI